MADDSSNSAANRRSFTRIKVKVGVELDVVGHGIIVGLTDDLSLNGLFLDTDEVVPVGTSCSVSMRFPIDLPDALCMTAQARVARVRPNGLALHFHEIPLETLEHLRNLIRYQAADEADRVEAEFGASLGIRPRR